MRGRFLGSTIMVGHCCGRYRHFSAHSGANPQDRAAAISKLQEAFGGKVEALYFFSMVVIDAMAVTQAPSNSAARHADDEHVAPRIRTHRPDEQPGEGRQEKSDPETA
jgi:hypothetical protein